MRASKKHERDMNKLAAMLEAAGIDATPIQTLKELAPQVDPEAASKEGEAVLLWLQSPSKFIQKICKRQQCQEPFGTNYRSVAYCSDGCRSKDIEEILGVKWDWTKSDVERWGGEPPLIIPPKALHNLQRYVRFFVDNLPSLPPEQNLPETTTRFLDQSGSLASSIEDLEKVLNDLDAS